MKSTTRSTFEESEENNVVEESNEPVETNEEQEGTSPDGIRERNQHLLPVFRSAIDRSESAS